MRRRTGGHELLVVVNLAGELRSRPEEHNKMTPSEGRRWTCALWTEDRRFGGPGSSVLVEENGRLAIPSPGAAVLRAVDR
jgi:hypothetical protein